MTAAQPPADDRLARRLGLRDAVVIGLASMIGAGVFAVWGPAAQASGAWLLAGLAIAGFVAFANAGSTGQLAARYPESGGAYRYGRERLGEWPGFLAGWGFVVGKTASCAAMAMTAADYLLPGPWEKPVAVLAVVALSAVNLRGITRTARAAAIIVVVVLGVLALVLASGVADLVQVGVRSQQEQGVPDAGWYGVLQSAGLLFFAFAGYARIATLGEEVRDPARTIPRAIAIALGVVVAVYGALAVVLLLVLGPAYLAAGVDAPLADLVAVSGWAWAVPVVQVGAGLAALGALLALIAGIGRTALAMARDRELPAPLAAVHPRFGVPHVAEIAVAVAVVVLVLVADLRGAIGFSSFGVLVYYLVANASALTQPSTERRVPRWLSAAGAIGCLVLVATLPVESVLAGLAVFAVGAVYRSVRLAVARRRTDG
ncbi:amino acid/polyamine/organocation transporter (APC superfamily) [Agromyces ramosus]|uniref:Amino acid/polyamine/organocation transporter (APC superfamily) n=1 Tax=Agromyces ramosus TaxID=33879 RepID=A0A4Q7MBN7_9MICO|nr:APC family permease [Agromyces ramosus]RZS64132.1 amino acid/polyamine/organocation transporter (APC superfamily) [Agromyces ramosus]